MDKRVFLPDSATNGLRLDVFVAQQLSVTRSQASAMIRKQSVLVNDSPQKCGYTVCEGDVVTAELVTEPTTLTPQNLPLGVLYEDDSVVVLNKPQGLSVHPGGGVNSGTLANALLYHYGAMSTVGGAERPGIVHRLDKDTSGVMVIARTDQAHRVLSRQFAERSVKKLYEAILEGNPKSDSGEIQTLIDRDPKNRKLMAVCKANGREAVTRYRVLERFKQNAYAEFTILTGRTHQIRVHAKYLGNPVVGDKSYGYKKQRFNLSGQLLHAKCLTFTHPVSGQELTITAPPPADFTRILSVLRSER